MMDEKIIPDLMWQLGPGGRSLVSGVQPKRDELIYELQKYIHVLGPTPRRCLETLAELGLSDPEIGRYFNIPRDIVTGLRQVWKIDGEK
ncbi:hypothetical protein ACEN2J_17625 [Pseudorhodobacter sp. W20_MBD10_FR17]|uniref:hypothetical protein n=1 Tax=Pseudorhodobacter sp. W20_MBD10_FR17 TaxID=3240266 RepID=UPI003F979138